MGSFIKKDLLVFWRDRKEILMALFLPIVIIVVLNLAFSGLFDKEEETKSLEVAIVQEDNESLGFEQFEESVQQKGLPTIEMESMLEQASSVAPSHQILELFNDRELKKWIKSQELSETDAVKLLENGEIDLIVMLPEGFTYGVLSSIFLNHESNVALTLMAKEQSAEIDILQDIVQHFTDSLNLNVALGEIAGGEISGIQLPKGGKERVEGVRGYTLSQYFTIAIGTLFALFLSQTVAVKTFSEKRERVFNRIILSNSNPIHYLMGKTVSTFFLTWMQMMITFTISQFFLEVFPESSLEFWWGIVILISAFALSVAGLSAVFTTLTLNLNDTNGASGLFTLIIMTFGVLGGSFFPIQGLPELFQIVGEWTPNGITQIVMIKWIQLGELSALLLPVSYHILFLTVCLTLAISMFPRRGRI